MTGVVTGAGAVSLAGLAGTVASLAYLHRAPTGLSPLRNAVSQYGITPYRAGYRAATICLGVAGAALAVGVAAALHGSGRLVVALLAVFAVARLVISWFPMDTPGAARTSTGTTHGLIALVTFGAATVAAFRLGTVLSRVGQWHALAGVSTGLGWAMAVFVLGMILRRSGASISRYFGLIERGLYVAIIAWAAVFAVACVVAPSR
jgi:hypothetical protein